MDGLIKGVIKPFQCHTVTTSLRGSKMFDTMR